MTFYSPSSGQVFLPTSQFQSTGVFLATTPSMSAIYQPPPHAPPLLTPSSSPGVQFSLLGRYGFCFRRSASVVLGTLLIGCGCASLAGATMGLIHFAELNYVGTGFWCGAVFVTAGGISIAAGHHRTDSLIIGAIVMSGVTVIAGIVQVTLTGIALTRDYRGWTCPIFKCAGPGDDCVCYTWEHGALTSSGLMVVAGGLAVVFGFTLFVLGIKTTCCRHSQQLFPMAAPYLTMNPHQHLSSDVSTAQKVTNISQDITKMMIPIPLQVGPMQCAGTTVSLQPSPNNSEQQQQQQQLQAVPISRNLLQESL